MMPMDTPRLLLLLLLLLVLPLLPASALPVLVVELVAVLGRPERVVASGEGDGEGDKPGALRGDGERAGDLSTTLVVGADSGLPRKPA